MTHRLVHRPVMPRISATHREPLNEPDPAGARRFQIVTPNCRLAWWTREPGSGNLPFVATQRAEVIKVPDLEWDGGAPMPVLIATDYRTLFACYLPTNDDRVVVGEFERCTSVRFGLPNDEVIHGHPRGTDLMHYGVHVIDRSPWIDELREIESVHRQAAEHPITHSRHYFLTFHDSSMEAVATNLAVVGSFASMPDAIAEMLRITNPR